VNCRTHEHRHFERTLRVSDSVRYPHLAEGREDVKTCRSRRALAARRGRRSWADVATRVAAAPQVVLAQAKQRAWSRGAGRRKSAAGRNQAPRCGLPYVVVGARARERAAPSSVAAVAPKGAAGGSLSSPRACPGRVGRPRTVRRGLRANHVRDLGSGETTR
jgi:hypothetical protein